VQKVQIIKVGKKGIEYTLTNTKQEAQLPQRNSASAAHMEGGWG